MFFTLMGLYAVYYDTKDMLPSALNLLIATVFWGLSTFSKWTGVFNFIFVVHYILLKIV